MRNKLSPRKFRAVLSITLSIIMLIGTCLVVPATTLAQGESSITIDFENNTTAAGGGGGLKIEDQAGVDDSTPNKVFSMSSVTNAGMYRSGGIKDPSGEYYTLSAGVWEMTYDYKVTANTDTSIYLIHNFNITKSVLNTGDSAAYCSGEKVIDLNLIPLVAVGAWKKGAFKFIINEEITNLGFACMSWGTGAGTPIYFDNVKFTKVCDTYVEYIDFEDEVDDDGGSSAYCVGRGGATVGSSDSLKRTENTSKVLAAAFSSGYAANWAKAVAIKRADSYISLDAGSYNVQFDYLWYERTSGATGKNPELYLAYSTSATNALDKNITSVNIFTEYCKTDSQNTWDTASFNIDLPENAKSIGFWMKNAQGHIYIDNIIITEAQAKKAEFIGMDGNVIEVEYSGDKVEVPTVTDNGLYVAWKDAEGNLYKKGQQVDPAISANLIPVYVIDFEDNTLNGSGFFKTKEIEGNKVFYANADQANSFNIDRYTQLKLGTDTIKLSKGSYEFKYSYFITEEATELAGGKPVIKLAETSGLSAAQSYANGTFFGDNLISFTDDNKGKWIEVNKIINIENDVAALGFYGKYVPREIRIDDIVLRKIDTVTFAYSDGTTEVIEYKDGMKIPEDKAINFKHWEDSDGTIVSANDPADKNESYKAVLNDNVTYNFNDFKDTQDATKTSEGITVQVEKLTNNFVVVPIVNESGKKIVLNKNTGYLVRAEYMSQSGEEGKAGDTEKKCYPEILISNTSAGYAPAGIALSDKSEYGFSKWTYIKTGSTVLDFKLKFSARNADLSEIYVKSIEILPFDLAATQADDSIIDTTVEMFYNGTDKNGVINTKNKKSDLFGREMPAKSAVYLHDDGSQRSLMRFVTNYAYADGDNTQLKISDELSLPISKRRLLVGKEGSTTAANGIINTNDRLFADQTKEKAVTNDCTCWKLDEENGVISHSLMLKNIKGANREKIYEIQSYLTLDVVDGTNVIYKSWTSEAGGFNSLLLVEPKASVSAQIVYTSILNDCPDLGWYNN